MVYMSTGHTSPPADTSAREGVREGYQPEHQTRFELATFTLAR
jgi:hypothetical protein